MVIVAGRMSTRSQIRAPIAAQRTGGEGTHGTIGKLGIGRGRPVPSAGPIGHMDPSLPPLTPAELSESLDRLRAAGVVESFRLLPDGQTLEMGWTPEFRRLIEAGLDPFGDPGFVEAWGTGDPAVVRSWIAQASTRSGRSRRRRG